MISIEKNQEIKTAISAIMQSMFDQRNYLADILEYLEKPLTPGMEKKVETILKKYGMPGESLALDERVLTENPYFKNIRLDKIETPTVKYSKDIIPKRTLMNTDFNRQLGKYLFHYHPVGYFNIDLEMPSLKEGNITWMSPAPSEIISMGDGVEKGTGKCLTMGLGIGLLPYLWLLKDEVESVTVIEHNKDVIDLFNKVILPQFNTSKSLEIIHGDAFEYFTDEFLNRFDYAYIDFWESNEDGLVDYIRLMEKKVTLPHIDFWIEESILSLAKQIVALYLITLYQGRSITEFIASLDEDNRRLARKANKFFKKRTEVISTEEELLYLIHDRKLLRELLSVPVSM
ncbi:hypothetical protein [Youngiibacter multivorans]|uniref:Methyltransferase n=1 Tax=Youngiibacter multivorans TaxID=937251 RepID=A0ABS4G8V8_9CLOT|nr:hypothetical protein [Youngiibacter multivorans]MBP1920969.1 hypothetical protein [Youngiibacter multivorans]